MLLCNLLGSTPFSGRDMPSLRHNIANSPPILPRASPTALQLLGRLLNKAPSLRITIAEARRHPWLQSDAAAIGTAAAADTAAAVAPAPTASRMQQPPSTFALLPLARSAPPAVAPTAAVRPTASVFRAWERECPPQSRQPTPLHHGRHPIPMPPNGTHHIGGSAGEPASPAKPAKPASTATNQAMPPAATDGAEGAAVPGVVGATEGPAPAPVKSAAGAVAEASVGNEKSAVANPVYVAAASATPRRTQAAYAMALGGLPGFHLGAIHRHQHHHHRMKHVW